MSSGMHSIADNPFKMKKLRHDITVVLTDGRTIEGKIFVGYNERILDVLNDKRTFVPMEDEDGNIIIISKDAVVTADTRDVAHSAARSALRGKSTTHIAKYEGISPYKVLELPDGTDITKVRKRYLKIREILNLSALEEAGVDKIIMSLAKLYLTQIETAYQMVSRIEQAKLKEQDSLENQLGAANDEEF